MLANLIAGLLPQVVRWRRHLHRNPELSGQEAETAAFVQRQLQRFGVPFKGGVGGHGVIATIAGMHPGPEVLLRADMDALPIQDEKRRAYRSGRDGVTHACGHDAHTATLLGVASVLSQARHTLHGKVTLLFQPAEEEPPGGARQMVEAGALEGASVIFALHYAPFPVGQAATATGLLMGLVDRFTIRITGEGGHAAQPHQSSDCAVAAAQLLLSMQTVVSRDVDPVHPAVITVGRMEAGTAYNAIAGSALLSGTVRCLTTHTRDLIRSRLTRLTEATGLAFGVAVTMEYAEGYPPLVNDPTVAKEALQVAQQVLGKGNAQLMPPMLSGDDFSIYLQRLPGCYLMVGAAGESASTRFPLHHPRFDIDERALGVGMRLLTGLVLNRLAPDQLPNLTANP